MIAFVKGEVVDIEENKVVLECNHMGYNIYVPTSTVSKYVNMGEEIKLYTYLHVKEDLMQLFGFLTKDDLQIFQLLIGVNGIGPKGAIGILSGLSSDELRFAVLADDAATISKAPGIGKKTAAKLILELKDKLNLEDAFEQKLANNQQDQTLQTNADTVMEAVQALVALGYGNTDALRAVKQIENAKDMGVEELLKAALKKMSMF